MRKENQGLTEAGEFGRVPGFFVVHFSFFVVPGRAQKHTPHKTTRQGRSYLSMGRCIYPCGIHVGRMQYAPTLPAGDISIVIAINFFRNPSFSCLDTRKGSEKKIKASGMPANLAGYRNGSSGIPGNLAMYPPLSFLVCHFLIYLPLMIQIEDTIVSLDVIERRFMCDLSQCRGACCIEGESGAPLEEGEAEQLRQALPAVWDELKEDAREVIRQQGVSYLDADGDEVTSIVNGRDCVFTRYAPDGTCHCALEQAFREGRTTFMKPISCRLYPVRVTQYRRFRAVNLHRWEVCRPAEILGERLGIPAYRFLREPLISKFGTEWYAALEAAAEMVARQSEQK